MKYDYTKTPPISPKHLSRLLDDCQEMRRKAEFWQEQWKILADAVDDHLKKISHMDIQSAKNVEFKMKKIREDF